MKKIFILVTLLIVGTIFALFKIDKDIHVERSLVINASNDEIKKQIVDFKKFQEWSPWATVDPNATATFNDKQGEVGATFEWSGNDEVGTGKQTITEISENKVKMDLEFTAPHQSTSEVYYTLEKENDGTKVTWGYDGKLPIMVTFMMDMDRMLGDMYEEGLQNLKVVVE